MAYFEQACFFNNRVYPVVEAYGSRKWGEEEIAKEISKLGKRSSNNGVYPDRGRGGDGYLRGGADRDHRTLLWWTPSGKNFR